ncbi:MAG: hypothetical protein JXA11_03575 [Phycisphaerae bacterium]|nr:hypothetical protein [Phycisphaerae bacterium]
MRNVLLIVLVLALAVAAVAAVYFIFLKEKPWEPFNHIDNTAPPYAYVYLLSPQYVGAMETKATSVQTDFVTVIWDKDEIFKGRLPKCTSWGEGVPSALGHIQTKPGTHVLKVIHENGQHQEMPLYIQKNQQLYYQVVYIDKQGNKTLIQSLGTDPGYKVEAPKF